MNLGIGLVSVIVAGTLLYFGLADKNGDSPRFLRFSAALVIYPPFVLVFSAFGAAELLYSFMH